MNLNQRIFPFKVSCPSSSSPSLPSTLVLVVLALGFFGSCQGEPQRFTAEPEDAVISKGQVHFLKCAVENQVGEVQWLRDGFGLGPGPEFEGFPRYRVLRNQNLGEHTLMVTNVQLEDDAYFECQVGATESTPGLQSYKAKLTVLLPPDSVQIDGAPVVEVLVNTSYNLTCRANNGKPAPLITWQSNFLPLLEIAESVIVTQPDGKRQDVSSYLTIHPQKSDQGRSYECHAVNDAMLQRMWTKVQLEVIYSPEVTMTLAPGEQIKEHNTVTITCVADSTPVVSTWRWFLGGELVVNQTSNVLLIRSIHRQHHGKTVTCEATNKAGTGHQTRTLDIAYGPEFKSSAEDIAADLGDSVKLSCLVDSNPPSTIIWRKKDNTRVLGSDPILVLSRVSDEDFGTYVCTVTLSGFEEISQQTQLLKKGPQVIVSQPEQFARYGEVGVIECIIQGVPKPKFVNWSKDNKPLDLNTLTRYKLREEDAKDGRHSILEISNVQDGDFGTYNCTTDNGYGQVDMTIAFSRKAVLPLPYILAAVLSGILLIIIISIAIFVYRRRKSLGSEKGSDGSECSITKKKDALPDIKVEYSNGGIVSAGPSYGVTADPWNTDVADARYHPHYIAPTPYVMPVDPWTKHRYVPSMYDPYIMNPHAMPSADIYGTYPRRPRQSMPYRGDNVYGADMYGTLRGALPSHLVRPIDYVPPPASPTSSRLSTNV